MRKIIFSIIALTALSFTTLNAQTINPRVELGTVFTTGKVSSGGGFRIPNDISLSVGSKLGFRFGAGVEIGLAELGNSSLYFVPSLTYKMHGLKVAEIGPDFMYNLPFSDFGGVTEDSRGKIVANMHDISLPLNLGMRMEVTDLFAVSFEVGPYLQYTLSAKAKATIENHTYESDLLKESNMDDSDSSSPSNPFTGLVKKFDAGLGANVAFEYSKFFLRMGYNHSLMNRFNSSHSFLSRLEEETKAQVEKINFKTNGCYVTLGYRF